MRHETIELVRPSCKHSTARGQHPGEGGWSRDNVSWLLARAGPVGTAGFGALAGCPDQTVRSRGGFFEASTDLFRPWTW